MRGSHLGAFEVAHQIRDGAQFHIASEPVEDMFDLVIVGSGISGLAAAYFHQKRYPNARILLHQPATEGGAAIVQTAVDAVGAAAST